MLCFWFIVSAGELSDSPEPVAKVEKLSATPIKKEAEKKDNINVVSKLEKESLHTYGPQGWLLLYLQAEITSPARVFCVLWRVMECIVVRSWSGSVSTVDSEVKRDQQSTKRSWDQEYDDELDRGKVSSKQLKMFILLHKYNYTH